MSLYQRALVRIDHGLFGALWRMTVGFGIVPAWEVVGNQEDSFEFVLFFLAVLLMLRVAFGVLRRAVHAGAQSRQTWAVRRLLGKRYDSYQWRKLLWFGLGLALYAGVFGSHSAIVLTVTLGCLFAGMVGWVAWRRRFQMLREIGDPLVADLS